MKGNHNFVIRDDVLEGACSGFEVYCYAVADDLLAVGVNYKGRMVTRMTFDVAQLVEVGNDKRYEKAPGLLERLKLENCH